jgi:hypothetical protein
MQRVYIKRRIMVVVITMLTALVLWGGVTKAPVNVFVKTWNIITAPTFECSAGEEVRGKRAIWNITKKYCKGNLSDATKWVMDLNNIKSKDLGVLPYGLIITIKEKKGK